MDTTGTGEHTATPATLGDEAPLAPSAPIGRLAAALRRAPAWLRARGAAAVPAAVAPLLAIVAMLASLRMGDAASGFLPSLNVIDPPLAHTAPAVAPATRRLSRHVVLVILDGLRADASRDMPFLQSLRARGAEAVAMSHYPTITRPNMVSIIAGVEPRWSGVRTNDYGRVLPLDSLPARARVAGLRTSYLSDTGWAVGTLFQPDFSDMRMVPWKDGLARVGPQVLGDGSDLHILVIAAIDEAGHRAGARSELYRQRAQEADATLAAMFRGFDYQQETVVVVADHGHLDRGGHGGVEAEVVDVPLILAGAGVRPGAPLLEPRLIDVAPTVAALLGVPAPGHSLGHVLVEALDVSRAERDHLLAADVERIAQLDPVLLRIVSDAETVAWRTRVARGMFVLLGLAALVVITVWASRRRLLVIDARILIVSIPAFPLVFYGLYLTMGRISPSMVGSGRFVGQLFEYGAIAAVAHLAVSWIALAGRREPRERIAAASGITATAMLVALAPAGIAWVVAGPPFVATPPEPAVFMLPPVTWVALCFFFAATAVTMTVEYVVYLARVLDPRWGAHRRAAARASEAS